MSALAEAARARREHAVALAQPMVGLKMVGDPTISLRKGAMVDREAAWRVCQYASAILARDPSFSGDLGHLYATWPGQREVIFFADLHKPLGDGARSLAFRGGRATNLVEVARVTLPVHVVTTADAQP